MIQQNPYFLTALDEWHFERLDRALTPEVERQVSNLVVEVIEENPINEERDDEISLSRLRAETGQEVRAQYRTFFSDVHGDMQGIITRGTLASGVEITGQYAPQGADKTAASLVEACGSFLRFPQLVQERTASVFERLVREDIDRLFLEAHEPPERFTEQYLEYWNLKFQLCGHLLKANLVQLVALDMLEVRYELERKIIPYLHKLIFADLATS